MAEHHQHFRFVSYKHEEIKSLLTKKPPVDAVPRAPPPSPVDTLPAAPKRKGGIRKMD